MNFNTKNIQLLEIGKTIQAFRESKNLSLETVCAGVIHVKTLKNIEAGKSNPSVETLFFLSQQLGVSLNELFSVKQNRLLTRFNEQKTMIFVLVNEKNSEKIKEFRTLITQLLECTLPIEVRIDVELYDVIAEYAQTKINDISVSEALQKRLVDSTNNYEFQAELTQREVLFVTILLECIDEPLQTRFYQALKQVPAYQTHTTIRYRENIYLLETEQWQQLVKDTKPYFEKVSLQTALAVLLALYIQVTLAYHGMKDEAQTAIYLNHSLTLLGYYPDEQLRSQLEPVINRKTAPQS